MGRTFKLPDLGEGIHEGEIRAVHVAVGQQVKEGDILLEVETDKAAVEIPSPYTGKVVEIRVKAGDIVHVGDVLIAFEEAHEQRAAAAPPPDQPSGVAAAPPVPQPAAAAARMEASQGPVPASPATRRLARELGVDLHAVLPSGRGGVVTAEDVRAFAAKAQEAPGRTRPEPAVPQSGPAAQAPQTGPAAQAPQTGPAAQAPQSRQTSQWETPASPAPSELPDFARWGPVERVPLRSLRRATARQMAIAWSRIPHVNSQETIDLTRLEEFRQAHKAGIEALGGRLTHTVFALKAAAAALKAFPRFNLSLDTASGEMIFKKYYHIGLAVNTEEGLIVPVIRDVDRKSIRELAVEIQACVQRTRARKVSLEELQGGTFTITNAGAMGGGFFTPIINHPQVAILGMGQARLQAAVVTEPNSAPRVLPRLIMPAVLCIDHRVLDGADAIAFLQMFKVALENPDELLMTIT